MKDQASAVKNRKTTTDSRLWVRVKYTEATEAENGHSYTSR